MSKKDNKVRVTMTINKELFEDWKRISKKINISRSAMLREMLEEILPVLDNDTPDGIIKSAMIKSAEYQKELANTLFKDTK